MRVLICGDRDWDNYQLIENALATVHEKNHVTLVIHGACKGADTLGEMAASVLNIKFKRFPAKWTEHGRAAGPIRNSQMLREGRPDCVLAFHNNLSASKGTKDMVNKAKKAGIQVYVISEKGKRRY